MSERKKQRRDSPISYRPPQALREEFYRRAERSGLSVSGFITSQVFGKQAVSSRRKPSVEQRDLVQFLGHCAAIRDQLSRLESMAAFTPETEAMLADAHRQLGELRAACFEALGRTP